MVLHTRGRVGRRQFFYKPLSTDLLREAFFALFFGGRRVLTWGRRVPEAAEKSPDVGRRYRCNICVSH